MRRPNEACRADDRFFAMTEPPRFIRFGIMCSGTTFPTWQARCLERLSAVNAVEPALLIVDERPAHRPYRTASHTSEPPVHKRSYLFWKLYKRLFFTGRSAAMQPVCMADKLAHLPAILCSVSIDATSHEFFADKDVALIKTHDLDFILKFGFGDIRGPLLRATRFGVWGFRPGDPRKYPGGPPAFWEIHGQDPVSAMVLERLDDDSDRSCVSLHEGFFKTLGQSYLRTFDATHMGIAAWPGRVCRDILLGKAPKAEASPAKALPRRAQIPSNGQTTRFALRLLRNLFSIQFDSLFRTEQWNVGVVDRPVHSFLTTPDTLEVRWLPKMQRSRFLADPFVVRSGKAITILAEEYDYQEGRGCISALQSNGKTGFSRPRPVIAPPYHVSYPYLVEYRGSIYCIPETADEHELAIYKATPFPHRWEKVKTLLHDFNGVDVTVFQHEGHWWLFCADGDTQPRANLCAWVAPDLFGPWRPHAANPLKTDVRSTRPAGTPFVHEGFLYRPSQDCSRIYGGSIVLNRVLRLTPSEFQEEACAVIRPDESGPYPNGLHTLAAAGDLTVIDGMRRVFVPHAFRRELKRKIQKVFSRSLEVPTLQRSRNHTQRSAARM